MVFTAQADNTKTVLDMHNLMDYQNGMGAAPQKDSRAAMAEEIPNFLAEHRVAAGLNQYELADKLGTTQNQVSRLETGKRKLTLRWLTRLAKALDKAVAELLEAPVASAQDTPAKIIPTDVGKLETVQIVSPPNASLANEPVAPRSRRYIDVLGRAAGGREGKFILNGERIDRIVCPPSVEAASNPYALYVYGTSMEPRYEDGDMVVANPDAPYRKGSYVVVQLTTDEENIYECYVKRFISFGKELVLEQLNPPKGHDAIMRFPAKRVHAIHKLVGPDGK